MSPTAAPRSPSILLVEDNLHNRRIFQGVLAHAGFSVLEAEDGGRAMELATASPPDLILMDLSIPVIDGWECTRRLKADPRTRAVPIIALTAHAMSEDRARCLGAGCTDYLSKPVTEENLLRTIARHLGRFETSDCPAPPALAAAGPVPVAVGRAMGMCPAGPASPAFERTSPTSPTSAAPAGSAPPAPLPPGTHVTTAGTVVTPEAARQVTERIRSLLEHNPRVAKLLPAFTSELSAQVHRMLDYMEQGRLDALRTLLHQIKGAAGGYGFPGITSLAARAESSIKESRQLDDVKSEVEALIDSLRRVEGYSEETNGHASHSGH